MATRPHLLSNLLVLLAIYAAFDVAYVVAQEPANAGAANTEIDIESLLRERCSDCHSAGDSNGGLNLDDPATFFVVGDSGVVPVATTTPQASGILQRVRSRDEDEWMPPEGQRLTEEQIAAIEAWITAGAAWQSNEGHDTKLNTNGGGKESDHWAFQPVTSYAAPSVGDNSWSLGTIDRFIQRQREELGLQVASDAAPEVLIRRASYGLTGLPPTPSEVQAFVEECAAEGSVDLPFSRLVDRLLNRPSYGERWGRHWMDWVRYADTAGDNSDFPIPQAYLYRNYIIDSLNDDLPYDRFLTEQLAGDLLPSENQAERNRLTIATGYLAMARRFGSLIERYPWHLTIEDTIDNVGRTMMGLTIACARCHDHKFDPVSTRDYYGLYGIFASTQYPQPGIELFQVQQNLVPLVSDAEVQSVAGEYQAETEKLEKELKKLLGASREMELEHAQKEGSATLAEQRKMRDKLDALLIKARNAGTNLAKHLKTIPAVPVAYAVQDGVPQQARVQIKGEPSRPGAQVVRRFPEVLGGYSLPAESAERSSGRLELASWITSPKNPLTARVIVNRVWQRHFGTGLVPSTSDFGLRGQLPTHPELLDWLAQDFMKNGWSIKHLHRLIMGSRTYRLSSEDLVANLEADPNNQHYWKFNRQRLDAESIRDSLLAISGELDPTPQIEPYPIPPQKDWEYTQHHPFKDDYPSNRRSVYLLTKRLTSESYFQTFDGPDPNVCTSARDESVTPLQALYFVNDEFLHEQAERYTTRLLASESNVEGRIASAFQTILSREPTGQESELLSGHLGAVRAQLAADADAENEAWASLIRSLFRLNEFLYID